jgi:hypothetical protein
MSCRASIFRGNNKLLNRPFFNIPILSIVGRLAAAKGLSIELDFLKGIKFRSLSINLCNRA